MTFQDIIFSLDRYWVRQGCAVRPGGVGPDSASSAAGDISLAGTSCPPSAGGAASRYRYQVLLRPSPSDARRLFLGALKAAGVELPEHDLRWEDAPAGACPFKEASAGWEVLLDGRSLAFFFYLQPCGAPRPPSAWADVDLERLALASQRRRSAADLVWSQGVTYADLHGPRPGAEEG